MTKYLVGEYHPESYDYLYLGAKPKIFSDINNIREAVRPKINDCVGNFNNTIDSIEEYFANKETYTSLNRKDVKDTKIIKIMKRICHTYSSINEVYSFGSILSDEALNTSLELAKKEKAYLEIALATDDINEFVTSFNKGMHYYVIISAEE